MNQPGTLEGFLEEVILTQTAACVCYSLVVAGQVKK